MWNVRYNYKYIKLFSSTTCPRPLPCSHCFSLPVSLSLQHQQSPAVSLLFIFLSLPLSWSQTLSVFPTLISLPHLFLLPLWCWLCWCHQFRSRILFGVVFLVLVISLFPVSLLFSLLTSFLPACLLPSPASSLGSCSIPCPNRKPGPIERPWSNRQGWSYPPLPP